jgi:hypothetical protein
MRKSIKDDEIYGPIRAEICDAYIVAGKPKPERNWLYSRLVKVTLENQELEMLFDLQALTGNRSHKAMASSARQHCFRLLF